METLVGRVLTTAKIENMGDLWEVHTGLRPLQEVRMIQVADALVDTGATTLALPSVMIQQLGLFKVSEKRVTSVNGLTTVSLYSPVRITIQDRACTVDVIEIPNEVPVLVGQIPLEMMDLVVDLQGRRLIPNPAHNGEQILELLVASRPFPLNG